MLRYFSEKINRSKHFESFDKDLIIILYYYFDIEKPLCIMQELSKNNTYFENWYCRHYFSKTDRKSIEIILKKIKHKFRYHHEWAEFRKDLKSEMFRSYPKCWEDVLPDKIALWAARRLQQLKISNGDNCTDNYRVARVGNTCQEKRYRRQIKQGCCGYFDCIDICPHDGKAYRLGFNYGH